MSLLTDLIEAMLGNEGRHEADLAERPEPVLNEVKARARAATGITALVTALGTLGVSQTNAGLIGVCLTVLAGVVIAVANAILTIRAAYAARERVTPLSDPRSADGTRLIRSWPTGAASDPAPGATAWDGDDAAPNL